jgi:hypothetical protein
MRAMAPWASPIRSTWCGPGLSGKYTSSEYTGGPPSMSRLTRAPIAGRPSRPQHRARRLVPRKARPIRARCRQLIAFMDFKRDAVGEASRRFLAGQARGLRFCEAPDTGRQPLGADGLHRPGKLARADRRKRVPRRLERRAPADAGYIVSGMAGSQAEAVELAAAERPDCA